MWKCVETARTNSKSACDPKDFISCVQLINKSHENTVPDPSPAVLTFVKSCSGLFFFTLSVFVEMYQSAFHIAWVCTSAVASPPLPMSLWVFSMHSASSHSPRTCMFRLIRLIQVWEYVCVLWWPVLRLSKTAGCNQQIGNKLINTILLQFE